MAIMSRRKKAVAAGWNTINKQRDEESKKLQDSTKQSEKISEEEHQERVKLLKSLGIMK